VSSVQTAGSPETHRYSEGRARTRNLMLAVAAVAAIPLVTGYLLFGRFVAGF
jgi:hypothetical protein